MRGEEQLHHVGVAAAGATVRDGGAHDEAGADEPCPESAGCQPGEGERPCAELQRHDGDGETQPEGHEYAEREQDPVEREQLRQRARIDDVGTRIDALGTEGDPDGGDGEEDDERCPHEQAADLLVIGGRDPVGRRGEEASGAFSCHGVAASAGDVGIDGGHVLRTRFVSGRASRAGRMERRNDGAEITHRVASGRKS